MVLVVIVAIGGIAGEAVIAGSDTSQADRGIAGQTLVSRVVGVVGCPARRYTERVEVVVSTDAAHAAGCACTVLARA